MSQLNSYQLLLNKLDAFIRKYYLNQIIRGGLFSLALIGGIFLIFNLLEYEFYFPPHIRKTLFYSFIGVSSLALLGWVCLPALRYFRLGRLISHEQAATIIGQHFTNVSDKLLNILQLKKASSSSQDKQLIEASINQKSDEIKPVPFPKAINLSKNRRYLRYALPPLLIIFGLLLTAPSIITESTDRIIRNNEVFLPEAPFSFVIENPALQVPQYENFELSVKTEGQAVPENISIHINNHEYRLTKKENNHFSYVFNTVQNDVSFFLSSGRVQSENFGLSVLVKPQLASFSSSVDYPAYTGYNDEVKENIGDLTVPEGSKITWIYTTEFADSVFLQFDKLKKDQAQQRGKNEFHYSKTIVQSTAYETSYTNEKSHQSDSVGYYITVIPDQYPSISAKSFLDSNNREFIFFAGEASDDYGLRKLNFNYRINRHKSGQGSWIKEPIGIANNRASSYEHHLILDSLSLAPGDQLEYYFEVFDNDAVNGSKSSRTSIEQYNLPTKEELNEKTAKNNEEIKEKLEENIDRAKQIQKELEQLREKLLNNKDPKWEDKKKLEELIEQQKELKAQFEKAQQQLEENLKTEEELKNNNEDLQEKQEKLQEMFKEVVDEDLQKLMEEIQKLMEELHKEDVTQDMQNMEMSEEKLEKDMDRLLELFKQLELEKDIQDQIEKLEELAKKQEELSEKTKESDKPQDDLEKEQEQINKEFEDVQKKQEDIMKKNEELEKPKPLDDAKEEMEDIEQDLDEAQDQLEQQQNQNASQSQKKAAEKMKKMAGNMQQQMGSCSGSQQEEDIKAIRQLLENLVSLSFDQEDLVSDVNVTDASTPRYVELVQVQNKLHDDFGLISDSLEALAKRNFQIESYVMDKVSEISQDFEKTMTQLEERDKVKANTGQRMIMKNTNDLALMLAESMQKMQQQMANKMPGNQMCNKPGGSKGNKGKVPMDKISEGQEKLGEELQKMNEGRKKGNEGKMSKEFAQAAARQAALKKALQEHQQEKQEQGKGSSELQKLIEQMDKMEVDLVNKRLDNEVLKRQMDIKTRLLQAEKAERQREWDEKRKSTTAKEMERKLPPNLEKYLNERKAEIELYQRVSPELKPYYKVLVEEYYKSLKQ